MIFSETKYDMTHRRWIMFQVMRGLAHMHKAGVFHRDLKPGNVLVNGNCDCKICDLGLARAQRPGQDMGEDLTLWTDYIASRW
jgi:mitogen-activated protein kinase 1/3